MSTENILYGSILFSVLYVLGIKYYNQSGNKLFLMATIVIEFICLYLYILLLKNHNSGILYTISKIVTIMLVLILSILLFQEAMSIKQWFGLLLATISILLLY